MWRWREVHLPIVLDIYHPICLLSIHLDLFAGRSDDILSIHSDLLAGRTDAVAPKRVLSHTSQYIFSITFLITKSQIFGESGLAEQELPTNYNCAPWICQCVIEFHLEIAMAWKNLQTIKSAQIRTSCNASGYHAHAEFYSPLEETEGQPQLRIWKASDRNLFRDVFAM